MPTLTNISTNSLAIEGPIVSGDSTFIRLSHTTSLTDTVQNKAETKATVSVEDDQKTLYPLVEKTKGVYVLGVTNFNTARSYRLNIKTSDGKIYQSDFVPMKITPAIDSIYIKQTDPTEITFYADTHDPANNTRYYRWDYKDTWSYVPIFHQVYQYKNGVINYVTPQSPDDVGTCYRMANSNQIIIGSTAKLSQDVVKQQLIFSVDNTSQKIAHPYVIQLHQYALTKEGFEYYQNLKTNTEQLGSIFDSQPTILKGNIHCVTNPSELVIGFLSASTIASKQFNLLEKNNPLKAPLTYIGITGINSYAYPQPYYESCVASIIIGSPYGQGVQWVFSNAPTADLNVQPASFIKRAKQTLGSGDSLLIDVQITKSANYYYYAPKACVDCRLRGGVNIKPTYYP